MYATLEDVRALGVTEEMATDEEVIDWIEIACLAIDESTGQFFESREMTMLLDGSGGNTLHIDVPIIELASVSLNGDDEETPLEYIEIYNNCGASRPDDRKNPRISWKAYDGIFYRSSRNQKLVGRFGYVEPDFTTPKLIQKIAAKLAAIYAVNKEGPTDWKGGQQNQKLIAGPITKELTDGHYIAYSDKVGEQLAAKVTNSGLLTTDPFIQGVIRKFMRPIKIASV